jgi:hypothetical protein
MSSTAKAVHRNYFIDLVQDDADGSWRVLAIIPCYRGPALLPPGFRYPDRATAEKYAQAAIDAQL